MTQVQFSEPTASSPPQAPRRRRIVVAVAAALIVFCAWAVARGPNESTERSREAPAPVVTIGPGAGEPATVAAAGPRSVASGRWAAGGTSQTASGVPVGYARSADGAAAAAVNYLTATSGMDIHLEDDEWSALVEAVALDPGSSALSELHAQASALLDDLGIEDAAGLRDLASVFQPVTVTVVEFYEDAAFVNVWGVAIFGQRTGGGGTGPVAAWETWRVEVVWDRDDWRIANGLGEKLRDGPTPAPNGTASPAGDVIDAVNGSAH